MELTPPALRWLLARASRYTQTVSWKHRISLVLLIVLTAPPLSATVCVMLCDSAAATRAAAHHDSGKPCDDAKATAPSSGPQVHDASGRDCSDHGAVNLVAATARANRVPGPSLLAAVPIHGSISTLADSDAVFDYRTPPGSTPPTAPPLVLRV